MIKNFVYIMEIVRFKITIVTNLFILSYYPILCHLQQRSSIWLLAHLKLHKTFKKTNEMYSVYVYKSFYS
jgi:hypothetical protein